MQRDLINPYSVYILFIDPLLIYFLIKKHKCIKQIYLSNQKSLRPWLKKQLIQAIL